MTSAQILQEILNNSDSDIADAESIFWVIKCQKWYYESSDWNVTEADDGRMDNNIRFSGYHAIQYNIRLLHRSQTVTTSNMKQMKTKYNSRIT